MHLQLKDFSDSVVGKIFLQPPMTTYRSASKIKDCMVI